MRLKLVRRKSEEKTCAFDKMTPKYRPHYAVVNAETGELVEGVVDATLSITSGGSVLTIRIDEPEVDAQ